MLRRLSSFAVVLGSVTLPVLGLAQARLEVEEGFDSSRLFTLDAGAPFERQIGGLAYAPDGGVLIYENAEIRLHHGDESTVLATIEPAVFGSFLVVSPSGDSVLFGESSNNQILSVPLAGGAPTVVDEIAFNFDLSFAPESAPELIAGRGFVSGLGTSDGNSIWLLDDDPDTPNDEIVADVSPFSGPLAFDPDGNLYVVTSGLRDPNTGASAELLVRFTAEQLAGAVGEGALSLSEGSELVDGFDGLYNLAWVDGKLYGTNLGFSTGVGTVRAFDPENGFETEAFASVSIGDGSGSPSLFAAREGSRPFEPGSGRDGGSFLVAYSNFDDTNVVDEIHPELHFIRGDPNGDGITELTDAIVVLDWLFFGGSTPAVFPASDVNGDGNHDVADPVYLLNFLFRGGEAPPAPFPERGPAS